MVVNTEANVGFERTDDTERYWPALTNPSMT